MEEIKDDIKDDIVVKTESIEDLQRQYLKKQVEKGSSLEEISNDYAKAKFTTALMEDTAENKKFHDELKDEQKETIKESFKQGKAREKAKTIEDRQKQAEAFYVSVRPILEMDFTNLVKPKIEKERKEYKDRSYGIPLMVLMLILFTPIYCIISIILALFNGVNSICETIATFSKVARVITISLFIIVGITLIVYCGILGIEALFNVEIINKIL